MMKKLQVTLVTAVLFAALLITASPIYSQVGDNTQLTLAWHEASDDVFSRGYVLTAGGTLRDQVDIDQDGRGEFLTYEQDGGQKIIYLFEATADNNYVVIWQYQFSDGTSGLAGGERGIMVTDIDHDGFQEIVVIVDSEKPGTTDGFNAGHIFEWDGRNINGALGQGLSQTPTATFDPPRDAADRVALENNSLAVDLDNDGNIELVLTNRGGNGKLLTIIQLTATNAELAAGNVTMTVEFDENFDLTTMDSQDSVRFQAKNTGFGLTDIDRDGNMEIILFDDNSGFVRVYEGNGSSTAPTFTFVREWQPNPTGWTSGGTVKSQIPQADFDKDGVLEIYLSDNKGSSWIISPEGDVGTMFNDANWTKLHDWKVDNVFNEGGENRGNLIGDVDRDNKPDIYLAGNNFGSILDIEYDGGPVTDVDSYSFYVTAINTNDDVDNGTFARPANIQLVDMDGDGHLEILAIVPWSGANPVDNLLGLYVFEHDVTDATDIASLGNNNDLTLAWHEASDDVFSRGYVLTAGGTLRDQVDIDQDGWGEFLTYEQDGGQKIIYLFEATADNNYVVVWQYQFSDGTAGLAGGERGIMVTDIDHDGFQEIVVIVDSEKPGTTDGFNAGHIFEWDGRNIDGALGKGLSQTPTATFDPPRDAADRVALENNSLAVDLDNDGNIELVLTNRGGNGKLLTIIQLTATNAELAAGNVTMTVEFDENFDLTTQLAQDSVRFQAKNTGFGLTDIDRDGNMEIILFDDNSGFVRVYEGTGTNTYAFVDEWQPNPTGWASGGTVKSQIPQADFDKDGVLEIYLSDNKGNSWIISPEGDVATMFDDANWTKLHDWKVDNVFNEGGENRGNLIGDVDRDNKPDIYLAGNNFGSILDIEYDGGPVTDVDSYSFYVTAIDGNTEVDDGHFARPANIQLVDMDGDGHLEILAIVPWSGANPVDNLLGLYVFEYDNTIVGVDNRFSDQLPKSIALHQNYPNPFNPSTNIMYDVPAISDVSLRIYDLLGRNVATLVNELQSAGSYVVEWNGLNSSGIQVTSGIYFYRLEVGELATTRKMVLLR